MAAALTLDGTREGYSQFVRSLPRTVITQAPASKPAAAPRLNPRSTIRDPQSALRDSGTARMAAMRPRPQRRQILSDSLSRAYEAGIMTRLSSDWSFSPLSADAEIRQYFRNLRARSRDLERNDPYGEHYLTLAEQNVVGSCGIKLQMKVKRPNPEANSLEGAANPKQPAEVLDEPVNRKIERWWKKQNKKKNFSVTRDMSGREGLQLILRTMLRDGDLLIRKIVGYPNEMGFAVQILEGDYLDETYTDFRAVRCQCPEQFGLPFCQSGTHEVRMGVELQGDWKFPVAYWLLSAHPGDYMTGTAVYSQARTRIPVSEIIHPFLRKRPGQTRGVPAMAPAMLRLHMLGGYSEAELVAARAGAQKMGFIESTVPESVFDQYFDPETQMAEIDGQPGEIEELPVGKTFKEWDPTHPNGNFGPFNKEQLRGVAAGVNVSYTALSGNIEDVNYSSMRGGLLEEREGWKGLQAFLITQVIRDLFESALEAGILQGLPDLDGLTMADFEDYIDEDAAVFKGRRWPWVDPLNDVQAAQTAIEAGLETASSVIAERGGDLEDVYAELKYEKDLREKLDIKTAGDVAAEPPPAPGQGPSADQPGNADPGTASGAAPNTSERDGATIADAIGGKVGNLKSLLSIINSAPAKKAIEALQLIFGMKAEEAAQIVALLAKGEDGEAIQEIADALPAERKLYDGHGHMQAFLTRDWVTINHAHVFIDDEGNATKGPKKLVEHIAAKKDARERPVALKDSHAAKGNTLHEIDADKLDAAWQKDGGFYLPKEKEGESEVAGRRKNFKDWLAKNPGTPIEAPEPTISPDGTASFVDGRHRTRVMMDAGRKTIPVSLDADSVHAAIANGLLPASAADKLKPAAPAPVAPPKGGHLSDALKVEAREGEHADAANHALAMISKVHGGGEKLANSVGQTSIYTDADKHLDASAEGGYVHTGGMTHGILISDRGNVPHPAWVVTHETGHLLAHQVFGMGEDAALLSQETRVADITKAAKKNGTKLPKWVADANDVGEVMKAINKGSGVKDLDRAVKGSKGKTDTVSKFLRYSAGAEEKFARAYSQYIAHRTGDAHLLAGLNRDRNSTLGKMLHHTDEEFEPVAKAFDKLFEKHGMR